MRAYTGLAASIVHMLGELSDVRDLLDALRWLDRGPAFNAEYLYKFTVLYTKGYTRWMASERDAMITLMANLADCNPNMLRFDCERVAAERINQEEILALERITGLSDDEPIDETEM
jgi:hypothetical protein